MIRQGTKVKATTRWGYGSRTISGTLDRDYQEGVTRSVILHYPSDSFYLSVEISASRWEIEEA